MTVAELGLKVDSSTVAAATPALEKMAAASATAEAAATRLTKASAGSTEIMQRMLAVLTSMERDLTVVARAAVSEADALNTATAAVNRNTAAHRTNGLALMQSRNLMYQLVDIGQGIPLLFQSPGFGLLNLGNQMSQVGQAYFGQGGMRAALGDMGRLLGGLLTRLAPIGLAVAAIGVGFAALTTKINETAKTQVSFGDVVVATMQVAAGAIGQFFKPAIDQLGGWWKQFVDWVAPIVKNSVNGIIGTFVGAFNTIKDTWSLLPDAFASIFTKAMNGAIDIVQNGINGIIEPINSLLSSVNLPTLAKADLSGFKGTPSNADNNIAGIAAQDFGAAYGVDYAGQAFGAISAQAQKLALANKIAEDSAKSLGKTLKGPLTDGIDKLTAKTDAWVEAARGAFSNLGTTIIQAFTKGGNVVNNLLDSLGQKLGQFGENLANSGFNALLNMGLSALTSAFTPTGGTWGNGLWGSAIFAGVHHSGGIAGQPSIGRTMPADLFVNAPRYHSGGIAGMRPDEVPAILQRGERVIPRGQSAGGTTINLTVNGPNMTPDEVMGHVNRTIINTLRKHDRHPGRVSF